MFRSTFSDKTMLLGNERSKPLFGKKKKITMSRPLFWSILWCCLSVCNYGDVAPVGQFPSFIINSETDAFAIYNSAQGLGAAFCVEPNCSKTTLTTSVLKVI